MHKVTPFQESDSVEPDANETQAIEDEPYTLRPARPLQLELVRCQFMCIGTIDCVNEIFKAQILVELRFPGGALDPHLTAGGADMPSVPDGKLPQPPARWYANQIDIRNAEKHAKAIASNVFCRGDDLYLSLRFQGEYYMRMEMQDFPFDTQELGVSLVINCRSNGTFPCDLVVAKDAKVGVAPADFVMEHQYELDERMVLQTKLSGDDYPTLVIATRLYRRPFFVLINVFAPNLLFLIMACTQFCVPTANQEVRLAVTLTLVLAANAYRIVSVDLTPTVEYLTLVDSYVNLCFLLIFFMVLEGAVVGMLTITRTEYALEPPQIFFFNVAETRGEIEISAPAAFDLAWFSIVAACAVGMHAYFCCRIRAIYHTRRDLPVETHCVTNYLLASGQEAGSSPRLRRSLTGL